MSAFVSVSSLTKTFRRPGLAGRHETVTAVDRVDLEIPRNEIFGLVGESGCGKTSLSRALLYLDPPTSGRISLDGQDLSALKGRELRSFRRRMQIVFQDPNSALNPKMRIGDSIREGLENTGYPSSRRNDRVAELLETVGIRPDHRKRFPHEFSGGQKQRIVIARALAISPEFLILDEPVSNLDVSIQAQIINLLLDLKRQFSLTYLFISHDLNLVSYLSDRVGVMYRGKIVETGPAERILENPLHPYTNRLFSSAPGRNRILEAGDGETERALEDPDYRGALPDGYRFQLPGLSAAGTAALHGSEEAKLRCRLEAEPGHSVLCYPRQEKSL